MRKNNSKVSKKPSANGVRKASARSLNGPTKAKGGSTTCQDYLEIVDEIKEKWLDSPKAKKKAKTKQKVAP